MSNVRRLRAPLPNVGKCTNTGVWENREIIADCNQCLTNSQGDKDYFYCGGKCMNAYNINDVCNMGQLVAKTPAQCTSPCYQEAPPTVGGGCSDSFDCDYGQSCVIKVDDRGLPRGKCVNDFPGMDNYQNTRVPIENKVRNMFMGVY